jgi:hypothetical protein
MLLHETTGAVLSDNRVTNREITKTLQNLAKLNYSDMKQHPRELGSVDEMFQNIYRICELDKMSAFFVTSLS